MIINELKKGEHAIILIIESDNENDKIRLAELGVIPGNTVIMFEPGERCVFRINTGNYLCVRSDLTKVHVRKMQNDL